MASITNEVLLVASPAANTPDRLVANVSGSTAIVLWGVVSTTPSSGMKASPACCPIAKITVSQASTWALSGAVSSVSAPSASKLMDETVTASTPLMRPSS